MDAVYGNSVYGTINEETAANVEGIYSCHAQTSEFTGSATMFITYDEGLNPVYNGSLQQLNSYNIILPQLHLHLHLHLHWHFLMKVR